MVIASTIGLTRYALFANTLSVDDFGYYGLILLVLPFGVYIAHWGSLQTLNVELPIAYGRGRQGIAAVESRALGGVLVTSGVTAIVYVAVLLSVDMSDEDTRTALLLAAAVVLATTVSEFYILVLRVRRELVRLGSVYLIRASAAFCLGGLGAFLWGYKGAVLFEIAAASIAICAGVVWARIIPRRPVVTETAARIVAGFPLLVMDLVVAIRYTADRWFVATALPEEFAQYAFASITVTGFLVVYAVLYQAFVPQLLHEYGRGLDLPVLRVRARRLALAIAAVGTASLPLIVGLSEWLSRGIFHEYAQGLDLVPILYVGGIASLLPLYSVVVLASGRFYLAALATASGAAVAIVGGFVIVAHSPSIDEFAWLFLISQFVSAVAAIAAAEWVVHAHSSLRSSH
jgi:hypothetical protein